MFFNQYVKDISLILMTLTARSDKKKNNPDESCAKTWFNYLYEVIQELEKEKAIYHYRNTRQMIITLKGVEQAMELLDQLFLPHITADLRKRIKPLLKELQSSQTKEVQND